MLPATSAQTPKHRSASGVPPAFTMAVGTSGGNGGDSIEPVEAASRCAHPGARLARPHSTAAGGAENQGALARLAIAGRATDLATLARRIVDLANPMISGLADDGESDRRPAGVAAFTPHGSRCRSCGLAFYHVLVRLFPSAESILRRGRES